MSIDKDAVGLGGAETFAGPAEDEIGVEKVGAKAAIFEVLLEGAGTG